MTPCVLIPVYNNAETIADVVTRCIKIMHAESVLVVSDGSTDGSDSRAEAAGAQVVRLTHNMGKGAAIRTGLSEAKHRGFSHAVVLDADGQHLPEQIPRLLAAAQTAPKAIWIGVRRMPADKTPASSRRGRAISNFWTTLDGWQRVRDAQCGFRVYPIRSTLRLGGRHCGFPFEMEVLIRASWAGLQIGHVDVDVHYPVEGRVSHFDMRRDNWAFSLLSFRFFWMMLARLPLLVYRVATRHRLPAAPSEQTPEDGDRGPEVRVEPQRDQSGAVQGPKQA